MKTLTDLLQAKLDEVSGDLIAGNASAIGKELQENPDGKLSVSMGFKLSMVGTRIYIEGTLAYSRKFSDEASSMFEFNDPHQLPLIQSESGSVTIKSGDIETKITAGKFKNALKAVTDSAKE